MERASPSPAIEAETKSSRHSFKTDTNFRYYSRGIVAVSFLFQRFTVYP